MLLLFLTFRLALAAIFVVAGVNKLRDMARTQADLEAMGLPAWLVPTLSFRLPIVELAVAAMLLIEPLAGVGAACALVLLSAFTMVIAVNLLRGRRPACACFGALAQSPISWNSVARNLALMAMAGVVSGAELLQGVRLPNADVLAFTWATLATLWLLLLTRQNGRLLLRIEQLERSSPASPTQAQSPLTVGAAVPPLRLNDAQGRPFDLRSLRGAPALLLFLDAGCSHCRPLLAQLRDAQLVNTDAALVVISESAALGRELPTQIIVLVDAGWTTRELFGVRGTPAAVSVDAEGALAQPPVHGTSAVRAALDQIQVITQEVHHELAPV